jgi:hypothetical protein
VWNNLVNHKFSDGRDIIQIAYPLAYKLIKSDIELLRNKTFSWSDFELEEIDERNRLLEPFAIDITDKLKFLIKVDPLFELLTPEIISLYVNFPNYEFGTKIYDKVLLFHTRLLNSFRVLFFQNNRDLEKLEGEDIAATTPILRAKIRQTNQSNQHFRSIFFTETFDLCNFTLKCVSSFLPYASWRWIVSFYTTI